MLVLRKRATIIPISVTIAFLVAAGAVWVVTSNPSKATQCHMMISLINKGSSRIDQYQGKALMKNQLASELNKVSQDLAVVNLSDPYLQEWQNQFVNVFQTLGQAIENAGKALDSAKKAELTPRGRVKVEKAKPEIEANGKTAIAAATQADLLADKLNQYCSQP